MIVFAWTPSIFDIQTHLSARNRPQVFELVNAIGRGEIRILIIQIPGRRAYPKIRGRPWLSRLYQRCLRPHVTFNTRADSTAAVIMSRQYHRSLKMGVSRRDQHKVRTRLFILVSQHFPWTSNIVDTARIAENTRAEGSTPFAELYGSYQYVAPPGSDRVLYGGDNTLVGSFVSPHSYWNLPR
jgi:hypothetical protein